MEFCGCGSTGDLIKKLKNEEKEKFMVEDQIAALAQFILKGLVYLHARGTIHRDLKPVQPFFFLTSLGKCSFDYIRRS
jgi:serine/threonine protein kinase